MPQEPESPGAPVLVSVDTDPRAARTWLAAQFDAQMERADPAAMTPRQREGVQKLARLMWWADGVDDSEALLAEALPAAVRSAAAIPGASAALALYLRNLVNEAWGRSWEHGRMRRGIVAACEAWRGLRLSGPDSALAGVCWGLLEFLGTEFDVESALLTGRLDVSRQLAQQAATEAACLLAVAEALPEQDGREMVLREIRNEALYYDTVRGAIATVDEVLNRRIPTGAGELERLSAAADTGDLNSTDASELRGHLASLQSIVAAEATDWLRVDEGRCRFLYPFALRSPLPDVDRRAINAVITTAAQWRPGGLAVVRVAEGLGVSDAWQGTDPLGRAYGGAVVQLDDLVLTTPDGTVLDTITPSIRFSELGNHVVVVEVGLSDALPGRLAEVVHLASPLFGDLTEIPDRLRLSPATEPDRALSRLTDVVAAVVSDLGPLLDAAAPVTVSALKGSFGVVSVVERATVFHGTADLVGESMVSAPGLLTLFGVQPLVHPLPSGAASVADWAVYDLADVQTHRLLHLSDALLAANANVSLLASFGSPSYAVADIESYLEFAHSMHGLYQGWRETVREHAQEIAGILHQVEAAMPADDPAQAEAGHADALRGLAVRIERAELRLQSFVQANQATMLFVDSPTLVTSPALRIDLDTVLRSNRYDVLRAEFERAAGGVLGSRLQQLLEVCHRRIEQDVEDKRELRNRRVDRVVQAAGIGLGLMGVSGLVSVLQAGFDLKGEITWWLAAAILLLAAALGLVMYLVSGERTGASRTRTGRLRSRPIGPPTDSGAVHPRTSDDSIPAARSRYG